MKGYEKLMFLIHSAICISAGPKVKLHRARMN